MTAQLQAEATTNTQPTSSKPTMKAIVREKYGSPDVLALKDIPKPSLDDDSVLIRIRAASINAYDWHMMRGSPLLARMSEGLRRPKTIAMGVDLAGEIEAVGKNVTAFRPGDAVFGARAGALAEYVRGGPTSALAPKPAGLTFEQAAAVNMAGTTALQGLRDRGQLKPGQRVLVNGATGGVGTFAVQIAKALGAHVTAVCRTQNVELVRSLGADEVIDYTREDFTRSGKLYDLIFDVAASRSLRDTRRVLAPNGILVLVGVKGGRRMAPILARLLTAVVWTRLASKKKMLPFLAHNSKEDLIVLKDLIEAGKVRPVIDRTYSLSETADAMRYLEEGHARGKVVITV
jgi:NADPH:quinone reductase-like Zn-dependent oxidoreductase